jgi:hypothetical protein
MLWAESGALVMPIHSEKNLYPGVNAHLNSFLQDEDGGWESFHAEHIIDIERSLNQQLPSNYYAIAEKSLQISEIGLATEEIHRSRPDVAVYQLKQQTRLSVSPGAAPDLTLPLAAVLEDEDDYLTSIVVYRLESGKPPGNPVTRVEVLSPANKPPQSYYRQYMAKRLETLRAGLTLVEVDYLHESRPVINLLPSYADGEEGASPYTIVVSDPHPVPEQGQMHVYSFGVDEAIKIVEIPLAGKDRVTLDFGAVYHHTYEQSRFYNLVVDYEQEPLHFERYTEADRERIRQRIGEIRERWAK